MAQQAIAEHSNEEFPWHLCEKNIFIYVCPDLFDN